MQLRYFHLCLDLLQELQGDQNQDSLALPTLLGYHPSLQPFSFELLLEVLEIFPSPLFPQDRFLSQLYPFWEPKHLVELILTSPSSWIVPTSLTDLLSDLNRP